MESPVNLD